MHKDLTLSEHIHQHCNESIECALLAERHPLWARSCPELNDMDFIRLGLLRCISPVDSGRHFLQTNEPRKISCSRFLAQALVGRLEELPTSPPLPQEG